MKELPQNPRTEFALTCSWDKPETTCYCWKGYFQNDFSPDLRNLFCPETSLQHVLSTWWSHGSQNVSVHMPECNPDLSFAGEKDSFLFSLLCIFLCSPTPSFVYHQPSKLKANCTLFNHCLEKSVSWSLYKWAGTRICFNSFQSLWCCRNFLWFLPSGFFFLVFVGFFFSLCF